MAKLILGTVQFGLKYGINNKSGQMLEAEAFRILDFAYLNGITLLDTAASYGNSEELLGRYFMNNPTTKFDILTKFRLIDMNCEESLLLSISKLKVKSIHTIMFHSFQDYKKYIQSLRNLNEKYKNVLYKRVGVSVYTNEEIEIVLKDPEIDLIQAPFNMLDNENKRGVIFRKIKETGKELHTRSVFLQGLFFKETSTFPENLKELSPFIKLLNEIAIKSKMSLNDMAMAYVFSKKYIDGVLFGVDTLEQIKRNTMSTSKVLIDENIALIDSINISNNDLLNPATW